MNIDEVKIFDTNMMMNENITISSSNFDNENEIYMNFFTAFSSIEIEQQTRDKDFFLQENKKDGWFQKKPITVISRSEFILKSKAKDKKLLLILTSRKIERIQKLICLIAYEKRYLENPASIKFAPKEWWKVKERCGFSSSGLSQARKENFYALLDKAEKIFEKYHLTLIAQKTHFIKNS